METAKIEYLGDLRTKAMHLQSGNEIVTDAPLDNQGKGEAFSPTDLFVTSLGSCLLTIIGIAARNHKFSIDGTSLWITKIMVSNPRRVSEIIIELDFPDIRYTDKEKALIERSARTCPVAKSIHPDIIQTIKFNYK